MKEGWSNIVGAALLGSFIIYLVINNKLGIYLGFITGQSTPAPSANVATGAGQLLQGGLATQYGQLGGSLPTAPASVGTGTAGNFT